MRSRVTCLFIAALLAACSSSRPCPCSPDPQYRCVELLFWNNTDQPQRLLIVLDGEATLFSGILGTTDSHPKIVFHSRSFWKPGEHRLTVSGPGLEDRELSFEVTEVNNIHVELREGSLNIRVTHVPEIHM